MRVLAIDLGGTHATCAVVEDRAILAKTLVPIADHFLLAPILADLAAALRTFDRSLLAGVEGIGFGFCGLVDNVNSRVSSTNGKFIDAVEIDLNEWSRREFVLPLRLENDARLALLGECLAGAGEGETDVVMFTLGTGIGGVAMIDGRPLQGKHGQAGVLGGHTPVTLKGRRCTCGAMGCAESEASGWALPLVCAEWPGFATSSLAARPLDFENLFACAGAGDKTALEIREHCLQVWGSAAVSAIHAFDPELLLYGGGVMKSADVIIPFLQQHVDRNAWTPWGKVRVRAAHLGNDAALFGVISLFQQENSFVR
jgi:glucokinase